MFLMKSPPLVALQRKWEPFSPSRSCRYPICFSESEDDIARTTISTKVQMIINNLHTDQSSLDTSDEYGCVAQKKRKGAKGRGHKPQGSGRTLQERMAYGQLHCPADSNSMEFGPLLLHSSSDDSVDQDIEEAIQEYLRNKSQGMQHLPGSAESFHGTDGGQRFQKEYPTHDACDLFPANVKAEVVQQHLAPGYLGDDAVQWAVSPCSTSSNDSFEQSIKAEIEQFLNEKKRRETEVHLTGEGKGLDSKEASESLALKSQKEAPNCLRRGSLKQGGKAIFPRQLPEPSSAGTLKCLQPGSPDEPANFTKASQGHSSIPEQSKEAKIRQKVWEASKEQNTAVSDSSSDDGIEEAIQLYQLEKIKKEANSQTGRAALQKDKFRVGGGANITSLTIRSEKSALLGTPRKGWGCASQPEELSSLTAACGEPEKGQHCASTANRFADCAVALQASCHTDATAELMCAEAILDISKAILPPPTASDNRSLMTDPFCAQNPPPSHQESESNTVDSDDSIEQEIRAFLAAKAQAECLVAKSKENQCPVQSHLSLDQPGDPSRYPKQSICRTRQLSLSRKKKLKRVTRQIQNKPETLSEVGPEDHSKPFASQSQDALAVLKMGETGQQDPLATVSSANFANPLLWGLCSAEGRIKTGSQASQKYGMDDKSSSLDSDEDLDTAIKDLLRSKRKLRKKPKDQRVQCKKKVKFGDMEIHVLEDKLSGYPEGHCKSRTAPSLKSCLTRSQIDVREESIKSRTQTVLKGNPKSAKAVPLALECKREGWPKSASGPGNQDTGKNCQSPWPATSLTDDSSSVDSDDSIEQEIQKFLAEKARDATEATRTVKPLGVVKPQTAPPKAKCQRAENVLSKQRKNVKEGLPTAKSSPLRGARKAAGDSLCEGEWMVACVEDAGCQPSGRLQTNLGILLTEGTIKRPALDHQAVSGSKGARRRLTFGKAVTIGDYKKQSCVKPLSSFKKKKTCEFKISSKFIAGLKSAQKAAASVPVGKRQGLKREGGLSSATELGESCVTGVPGSRSEAGVSKADLPTVERLQPWTNPGQTQPPPLYNEALSLATENPAGGLKPPSSEAEQGPPLQAPDTDSIPGAKVSTEPLHLDAPVEEVEGNSQRPSTGWEEHSDPSSPSCLPLKENALTSPDRIAEERAQEVSVGGSAEFTDGPVAEQTPCVVKSKSSSFFLSTSIDPGWRVLPYIVLSPTRLLASKTLAVQGRQRALKVLGEKLGASLNSRMSRLVEQ